MLLNASPNQPSELSSDRRTLLSGGRQGIRGGIHVEISESAPELVVPALAGQDCQSPIENQKSNRLPAFWILWRRTKPSIAIPKSFPPPVGSSQTTSGTRSSRTPPQPHHEITPRLFDPIFLPKARPPFQL